MQQQATTSRNVASPARAFASVLASMTKPIALRAKATCTRTAPPTARHAMYERPSTTTEPRPVHPTYEERDEGKTDDAKKASVETFDPLDPASRRMAQIAPPMMAGAEARATNEIPSRARVSMEELLPQLVRRIAWAGDRRRGTVKLEIGTGRHEGTTVTVHSEDGRVRVELRGRDLAATDDLRQRLDARLRRHGLDVESVT